MGGGRGGAAQFVRGNYTSFKGINLTAVGKNAPVYYVYHVSRTTSE